jgi:hypothetical protein
MTVIPTRTAGFNFSQYNDTDVRQKSAEWRERKDAPRAACLEILSSSSGLELELELELELTL